MLNRIIGAFLFRTKVYANVERDKGFTTTAWILVVVVAFLNQLGAYVSLKNPVNWLISAVIATVLVVIGFALSALIISWVGRAIFGAKTNFGEVVRTTGLAYVWNIIGVLGILVALAPTALACILLPIFLITWVLTLLARLVAVKEALDLDWIRTIITVIVGWIVEVILVLLASTVLAMLGLGASAVLGTMPGA